MSFEGFSHQIQLSHMAAMRRNEADFHLEPSPARSNKRENEGRRLPLGSVIAATGSPVACASAHRSARGTLCIRQIWSSVLEGPLDRVYADSSPIHTASCPRV